MACRVERTRPPKIAERPKIVERRRGRYAPTTDATEQQRQLGTRGTDASGRRVSPGSLDGGGDDAASGWEKVEDALALGGSTLEEGLAPRLQPLVNSLSAKLWFDHTEPRAREAARAANQMPSFFVRGGGAGVVLSRVWRHLLEVFGDFSLENSHEPDGADVSIT